MALQLLLWLSALWTVHEAAPLAPGSSLPQSFLLKCSEQVRKIQVDSVMLQEVLVRESQCTTYKLCHPEDLVLLGHYLGILQAPLGSCSSQALQLVSVGREGRQSGGGGSRGAGGSRADPPAPAWPSQTSCLSQLHSGLVLYQGLLQALGGISPQAAPTVGKLQLDVADFATTIWHQMEVLGLAPAGQPTQGTMPTFTSAFQRRVGGVLVASHLQNFLELAYRVLRYLAQA
ncbi:granulocyte colony-stimulating factor [Ochotona princeps]|uniref:granulocyte colony-stimulating factor n=1 Tax=Ochotona princeps TaxID=9978 RepID=UPI002714DFB2|nr:granulocyte colony-stimulating factor [Ochotona princeps]